MTDHNSQTRDTQISSVGTLDRTVRRSEIVEHLTNFRISVDKAIHALPGVMLGVSCANVIQSSMNLTWHIEHLRGSLIEAMMREGYNPLSSENVVQSTSQLANGATSTTRGSSVPRSYPREIGHNPVGPPYSAPPSGHISTNDHIRHVRHLQVPVPVTMINNVSTANDQVVPSRPTQEMSQSHAYTTPFPAVSTHGQPNSHSMTSSDLVSSNQSQVTRNYVQYPADNHNAQATSNYSPYPDQYHASHQ